MDVSKDLENLGQSLKKIVQTGQKKVRKKRKKCTFWLKKNLILKAKNIKNILSIYYNWS